MKRKVETNYGITLIALVITIIVLLILAGVTIATLTGENGILTKATKSKEDTVIGREKEEIVVAQNGAKTNNLGQIVTAEEFNEQFTANGTKATASGSNPIKVTFTETNHVYEVNEKEEIQGPIVNVASQIKVGDYVNYVPNGIYTQYTTNYDLVTIPNQTMHVQTDLKWRVLSIEADGKLTLISDTPTSETIELGGVDAYNQGQTICDNVSKYLYSYGDAIKARNLKLSDVKKTFTEQTINIIENSTNKEGIKYGETKEYFSNLNFPSRLINEKYLVVDGIPSEWEDDHEKEAGIDYSLFRVEQAESSLIAPQTAIQLKDINESHFKNKIYYDLFIHSPEANWNYFLASRCIDLGTSYATYGLQRFIIGMITSTGTYASNQTDLDRAYISTEAALRPVVQVENYYQVDTSTYENGRDENGVWQLEFELINHPA